MDYYRIGIIKMCLTLFWKLNQSGKIVLFSKLDKLEVEIEASGKYSIQKQPIKLF